MSFDHLRDIELFRNLGPLHLSHLAALLVPLDYAAGEIIFRQGTYPEYLFVIRRGRVRISSMVGESGEEALAFLDAGSYFGEVKLIDDGEPYDVQAIAHTDCSLDGFSLAGLRDLLSTDQDLAVSFLWNMVQTLSARLKASNDKVAAMARLSSPI